MAKKMRKLLALVLALALTAGQLMVPAMATAETGGDQPAAETSTGGGTTTTTVTEGVPGSGNYSETTTTTSQTVDGFGNVMAQQTDSSWSSISTASDTTTQDGTPPAEVTETTMITKEGSESTSESYFVDGDVQGLKGSKEGQETSDTTITIETTTKEEDKLLESKTESSTSDSVVTPIDKTETGEEIPVESESGEGEWVEGEIEASDTDTDVEEEGKQSIDPVASGGATLEMTPGGKDSEKVDVTLEQALAGQLPEGAEPVKDDDGNIIGYRIVKSESEPVTDTKEGTPVEKPAVTSTTQIPTQPAGYTPGTTEEGNVTTTIEEIIEGGKVVGYKITTVTVEEEASESSAESTAETITETSTGEADFVMPERPEASTSTDAYGFTTSVTVTDIYEGGKLVAYKTTITKTDSQGNLVETESNTLYGTSSTSSTKVVKDPETEIETVKTTKTTTEVKEVRAFTYTTTETTTSTKEVEIKTTTVTEQDVYQFVETEDGYFFLYKGEMYKVTAIVDGGNYDHGEIDLTSIKPDANLIGSGKNYKGTDLRDKNGTKNGLFKDYINDDIEKAFANAPEGYDFQYVGNGQASSLLIYRYKDGSSAGITNHQFALRDAEGNLYYAYCADIATTAVAGSYYKVENLEDETYYQGEEAVNHIKTVVMNGYWGTVENTENDEYETGSLASVKALLKEYADEGWFQKLTGYNKTQIESMANALTEGEALSATQAAVWKYGNHDSSRYVDEKKLVENHANAKILFQLLTSDQLMSASKETSDTAADILNTDDITGTKLELKGQATDESTGAVKTVIVENADGSATEHNVYNADLTFSLSVEQSKLTGNLVVKVIQNGKTIATEQLVTDDTNFLGELLAGNSRADGGTDYTIKGLELAEGVVIDLVLEGYQDLNKGVYLYVSETNKEGEPLSQTFVGIAEGKQQVNLETGLIFTVTDPELEKVSQIVTVTKTDKRTDTKEDKTTTQRVDTQTQGTSTTQTKTEVTTSVYGTETTTRTQTKTTKALRNWKAYYEYLLTTIQGEDGGEKNKKKTTILDEEVPLADAPKTGDISGLWAAISGISLGGVALLSLKRKDEEA